MNKVIIILVLIKSFLFSDVYLLSTKEMKRNYFYKVHSGVQKAVNKIFILLKMNQNFTSNHKNRLLLTMHAAMKTIAGRNYETFKHIRTAAKLNTKKKPKNGLFDLNKLIKILISENLVPDHHIKFFSKQANNSGIHLRLTSLEIPEKSEESYAFLREYFYDIGGVELLEAVDSPLNKIKNIYFKNKKKRNLKKWGAPNVTWPGYHLNDTRRIFQGVGVSIKKYPFVASVHVMGDFVCGSAIISRGMVITAASCVQIAYNNSAFLKTNKDGISVRVGSDYSERFGELCYVSEIVFHPNFDPLSLRNNLAILIFNKKLHFGKKNKIRRIDYQNVRGPLPKNTTSITLLGWGDKFVQPSHIIDRLSISYMDIYDLEKCKNAYSRKFVTDNNFCTGFETKGSGACQRDVGGPAIFSSKLVGVVSFGPPACGMLDAPTVFTNLGHNIDWIESIVKQIPNNQKKVKEPFETPLPTQTKPQQMLNMLPSGDVRSRFDKNIRRLRAKTNPKHIQILNYLLDILVGEDEKGPIYDNEEFNKEKEYSNEFKSDEMKPNQKMQVAVLVSSTKHLHDSSATRIEKEANKTYFGENNVNINGHHDANDINFDKHLKKNDNNIKKHLRENNYNMNERLGENNIYTNGHLEENSANLNGLQNNKTPIYEKPLSIIQDTFHKALKNLKGYLGLSDIIDKRKKYHKKDKKDFYLSTNPKIKFQSELFTTLHTIPVTKYINLENIPQILWQTDEIMDMKQRKSAYVNNKMLKPAIQYDSKEDFNESDNYESDPENGLSIEIPSEIPIAQAVAVIMSTTESIAVQNIIFNAHSKLLLPQTEIDSNEANIYMKNTKKMSHYLVPSHNWREGREDEMSYLSFKVDQPKNAAKIAKAKVSKPTKNRYNIDETITSTLPTPAAQIHKYPGFFARNSDSIFLRQEEFENITYILNDSTDESTGSEAHSSSLERVHSNEPKSNDAFTSSKERLEKDTHLKNSVLAELNSSHYFSEETSIPIILYSSSNYGRDKTKQQTKQTIKQYTGKKGSSFEGTQIVNFDETDEKHKSTLPYLKTTKNYPLTYSKQKYTEASSGTSETKQNYQLEKEPVPRYKEILTTKSTNPLIKISYPLLNEPSSHSVEQRMETAPRSNIQQYNTLQKKPLTHSEKTQTTKLYHQTKKGRWTHSMAQQTETAPRSIIKQNYLLEKQPLTHSEKQAVETSTDSKKKQYTRIETVPVTHPKQKYMNTSPHFLLTQNYPSQKPLSHPKEKQINTSNRAAINKNYPSSVTSTHGITMSLQKTTVTPITAPSTATMRSLHETTTNAALVTIQSTSEEDAVLDIADMGYPLETTKYSMTLASYEHYPESIGEDEYDNYHQILSQYFGKGMSEILNR